MAAAARISISIKINITSAVRAVAKTISFAPLVHQGLAKGTPSHLAGASVTTRSAGIASAAVVVVVVVLDSGVGIASGIPADPGAGKMLVCNGTTRRMDICCLRTYTRLRACGRSSWFGSTAAGTGTGRSGGVGARDVAVATTIANSGSISSFLSTTTRGGKSRPGSNRSGGSSSGPAAVVEAASRHPGNHAAVLRCVIPHCIDKVIYRGCLVWVSRDPTVLE